MRIKVNEVLMNNLRYADDTIPITDNIRELQKLINVVGEQSQAMGLNIITKKKKFKSSPEA